MSDNLTTLEEVKATLTGASLTFHWWSPYKALERAERQSAASALEADDEILSARKRLLDLSHPAWRGLQKMRNTVREWWEYSTFPYVFTGIRLVKRESKDKLFAQIASFQEDIERLARALDNSRAEIIDQARRQMGRLFNERLYPPRWSSLFTIEPRERSIDPPSYLAHTNAEEYKRELARSLEDIRRSMQEFERQTWRQLSELTGRLMNNLSPGNRIMESNLTNFQATFDRVAALNFEGTAVFRNALQEAKDILAGVSAEELRKSHGLRERTREEISNFVGRFAQLQQTVADVNQPEALVA